MKCDRCPIEDECPELKKSCNIKTDKCPIELAIAFLLIAYGAFASTGKK